MSHRALTFLCITVLSVLVFVFFALRLKPIELPRPITETLTQSQEKPTITFVNPSAGAQGAKVTIVEYADFQCEACGILATSLDVILKTYPDDVRLIWKNLPNESVHEWATPAAIAAHCANKQNKFWEYHHELFTKQTYLSENQFTQIASTIGLDMEKFQSCYDERDTLPIVKKDYEEGIALGITATPALFINDELLIGAPTLQELLDLVQEKIASP